MKPSTADILIRAIIGVGALIFCTRMLSHFGDDAGVIALALIVASAAGAFIGHRRIRVRFGHLEVPDEVAEKMARCGTCRSWERLPGELTRIGADPLNGLCGELNAIFPEDRNAANCELYEPRDA